MKNWIHYCVCGARYETAESLQRHVAIYDDPSTHARRSSRLSDARKRDFLASLGFDLSPTHREALFEKLGTQTNEEDLCIFLYLNKINLTQEQKTTLLEAVERFA